MNSVNWLDEASQTVRLLAGSVTEGIRNGNSAHPAVRITPATAVPLNSSARPGRPARSSTAASSPPA